MGIGLGSWPDIFLNDDQKKLKLTSLIILREKNSNLTSISRIGWDMLKTLRGMSSLSQLQFLCEIKNRPTTPNILSYEYCTFSDLDATYAMSYISSPHLERYSEKLTDLNEYYWERFHQEHWNRASIVPAYWNATVLADCCQAFSNSPELVYAQNRIEQSFTQICFV